MVTFPPGATSVPFEDQNANAEPAEALMMRVAGGCEASLRELILRFRDQVVAQAAGIVGSEDAAEDVAQEVFVRLWSRCSGWQPTGSVHAFLRRLTRNLALNHKRGELSRRQRVERYGIENPRTVPTPADRLQQQEVRRRVGQAIRALPPRRRRVLVRARLRSASYVDVASAMAISQQTVANHLSRATADLRRMIGE